MGIQKRKTGYAGTIYIPSSSSPPLKNGGGEGGGGGGEEGLHASSNLEKQPRSKQSSQKYCHFF